MVDGRQPPVPAVSPAKRRFSGAAPGTDLEEATLTDGDPTVGPDFSPVESRLLMALQVRIVPRILEGTDRQQC